jgi:hypothetical protein
MVWSNGHVWTLATFLPPGTYAFKVVVVTPGAHPGTARWETGADRSLTIVANSPELGTAALVLATLQFDNTAGTAVETKRITGIGFKASSTVGNPHASQHAANGNGNGGAPAPGTAGHLAANAARAAAMAAAGIPTSKVTATAQAPSAQQQAYHQQQAYAAQMQQQQYMQPPVPPQQPYIYQAPAAPMHAAPMQPLAGGEARVPGTDAFNGRMAALDNQLATLLAQKNGADAAAAAAVADAAAAAAAADAAAVAAAAAHQQASAVHVPPPAAPVAPPPAAAQHQQQAPQQQQQVHAQRQSQQQQAAEMHAAAEACRTDPANADACHVVTKFIQDHLELIESQAVEMMRHNERLEQRMAVLEQHTQVGRVWVVYTSSHVKPPGPPSAPSAAPLC